MKPVRYTFFLTQEPVLQRSCEEMMANENFFLPFMVLLDKLLVLLFNFNKKVRRPLTLRRVALF